VGEITKNCAIALCFANSDRGTWWFIKLKFKAYFHADSWATLLIPDIAIDVLNSLHLTDDPGSEAKGKGKRLVAKGRVEKLGADAVKRILASTGVSWKKRVKSSAQ
jgi:hypothetical protein